MELARSFSSTRPTLLFVVVGGSLLGCADTTAPDPVVSDQAGNPSGTSSVADTEPPTQDPAADGGSTSAADPGVIVPSTVAATADVPDPLVQNSTVVSFEVTVPAYQSDALQLRLSWGEFSTALDWVGDEFWFVDAELPTSTERPLSVVFLDENGGIELGSVERSYTTGTNAAATHTVTADQFDTDRWDIDGDGISNIDELVAGTDPRVDEGDPLPVVDVQDMSLLFIANHFESLLPDERPYRGTQSTLEGVYPGRRTIADVDANGNGSMVVDVLPINFWQDSRRVERLVMEDSIRWIGTYDHRWETTVDVTGEPIDGSNVCEVASGTITERYSTNNQSSFSTTTLTLVKGSIDDPWRVTRVLETEDETSVSEHLARELNMHMIRFGYQRQVSEDDGFVCDVNDL